MPPVAMMPHLTVKGVEEAMMTILLLRGWIECTGRVCCVMEGMAPSFL